MAKLSIRKSTQISPNIYVFQTNDSQSDPTSQSLGKSKLIENGQAGGNRLVGPFPRSTAPDSGLVPPVKKSAADFQCWEFEKFDRKQNGYSF
jgi:hypothetical protein